MFFMNVFFNVFYKSLKNMFFMFFICKLMFLTSMVYFDYFALRSYVVISAVSS